MQKNSTIRLQFKPEDCSALGLLILQHLERNNITMNRLAEIAGIPQPRLRGACLKGTCPAPETLKKLATVMGRHHLELYSLAYEERIEDPENRSEGDSLEALVRELFATAREMGMAAPKATPSKTSIRTALEQLGFNKPSK
jgi:predicted XRE-type DNA-binding protein